VTKLERDAQETGWLPTERGHDTRPLQRQVSRGLTWTIVDNWGRQMLGFVVFVVLANLLLPADFGLVALAVVFVNFAQVFVDQGLGDALIQRRELTRSHIDTAFWAAMATGTLLTLLGLVLAIPIAALLREPELQPILQVLSLTFVLTAMSSIQIALLRRELAFRSLALRSIFATLAGGTVGIGMAYLGFGAWALVGQLVSSAVVSVLTLWWVLPWRPGLRFSREHFRSLFSFGINVVGTDAVGFFARNTDNLLIGAFLGTTPLGLYAVGYRVLDTSQVLLINIARKIAFPALSSLQHDRPRIQRAYFKLTRVSNTLILPAYVGLALIAPELIVVLFGQRWTDSGLVAAVLFLIGPVLTLQAFSVSLFYAVGHPEVTFRLRLITMIVSVAGFFVAVPFGILAVAAAFVVSGYLVLPLNLHWQRVYAGIHTLDYLAQLRGLALATAAMTVTIAAVKLAFGAGESVGMLLALEAGIGAAAFFAAFWLADRALLREAFGVAVQVVPGAERAHRRLRRRAELVVPEEEEGTLVG
jgi:O-antigen/teichoic acid export membrane protein